MPRPPRADFPGAWHHVMNRGARGQAIYHNDEHREIFLELLQEIQQRYGIELHAYCLMDNHYHLLLRTPRANLGRSMRHLDGVYTQRYNKSLLRDGSTISHAYNAIKEIIQKDLLLQKEYRMICDSLIS